MFEKKHSDPKAFVFEWLTVSRFEREYNFDRFDYRIFGVVYHKDGKEFREALAQLEVWRKLKR